MDPKNNEKSLFPIVRRSVFIPSHYHMCLSEGISASGYNEHINFFSVAEHSMAWLYDSSDMVVQGTASNAAFVLSRKSRLQ